METAFPSFVARTSGDARFSLLDIGCSGGIDASWRAFGPKLRALAIDASVAECERLQKAETHPGIEYVAGFVSDSSTAKVDLENGQASPLIFRMRDRLSFMRTHELREARLGKAEIEAMGSIVAGIALGILALRTRSFWYGVAIHGVIAVWMDWLSARSALLGS